MVARLLLRLAGGAASLLVAAGWLVVEPGAEGRVLVQVTPLHGLTTGDLPGLVLAAAGLVCLAGAGWSAVRSRRPSLQR